MATRMGDALIYGMVRTPQQEDLFVGLPDMPEPHTVVQKGVGQIVHLAVLVARMLLPPALLRPVNQPLCSEVDSKYLVLETADVILEF